MSQKSFLEFLVTARDSTAVLTRYSQRNLAQLLFHAGNEGFAFTADDVAAMVGALEASVIVRLDADPYDGTARLWRHMWGAYHLEYLVNHVVARHTDAELWSLVGSAAAPDDQPAEPEPVAQAVEPVGSPAIDFLRQVSTRADVLDYLKVRSKQEVVAAAADFGFRFTEPEFDAQFWDLELQLASRRGESFDAHFPLWHTMWGGYYLEYLAIDLVPSLETTGLVR